MNKSILSAAVIVTIALSGCVSTGKKESDPIVKRIESEPVAKRNFNDCIRDGDLMPPWVCHKNIGMEVYGVGSAPKSKAGDDEAIKEATQSASADAAGQMKKHVAARYVKHIERTGVGASETVDKSTKNTAESLIAQDLKGLKTYETIDTRTSWYVLVGIDNKLADQAADKHILSSMNKQSAEYQKWLGERGVAEMKEAIKASKKEGN